MADDIILSEEAAREVATAANIKAVEAYVAMTAEQRVMHDVAPAHAASGNIS